MTLLSIIVRNILFYISLIFIGLFGIVVGNIYALFVNRQKATAFVAGGAKFVRKSFSFFIGVKVEYRGLENLVEGSAIIASKHQSAYEATLFFNEFYPRLAYALKKEIKYNFFYLYFLYSKYEGIEVDRKDGVRALVKMESDALKMLKEGRQFALFPEGTRVPIGKEAPFKRGVFRLYSRSGAPVVPVTLNTGAVWPKDSKLFYPGKIIVEFLPAIAPGMPEPEFMARLAGEINVATRRLLAETPCNYYLKKRGLC